MIAVHKIWETLVQYSRIYCNFFDWWFWGTHEKKSNILNDKIMYTKYCKNDLNPPGRNCTGLDITNTQKFFLIHLKKNYWECKFVSVFEVYLPVGTLQNCLPLL